jgi:hypothetical protein
MSLEIFQESGVDWTADAELQAAFQHWRRRLTRLVESVSFNIVTILVVVVDISSTIYFQSFVEEYSKDCFGRDVRAEEIINILVMTFFSIELLIRILSQAGHVRRECPRRHA